MARFIGRREVEQYEGPRDVTVGETIVESAWAEHTGNMRRAKLLLGAGQRRYVRELEARRNERLAA